MAFLATKNGQQEKAPKGDVAAERGPDEPGVGKGMV
jgi:hypothetical protein